MQIMMMMAMTMSKVVAVVVKTRPTTMAGSSGLAAVTCVVGSIDGEGDGVCAVLHCPELEEEAAVLTVPSIHAILQLSVHWGVSANDNNSNTSMNDTPRSSAVR